MTLSGRNVTLHRGDRKESATAPISANGARILKTQSVGNRGLLVVLDTFLFADDDVKIARKNAVDADAEDEEDVVTSELVAATTSSLTSSSTPTTTTTTKMTIYLGYQRRRRQQRQHLQQLHQVVIAITLTERSSRT